MYKYKNLKKQNDSEKHWAIETIWNHSENKFHYYIQYGKIPKIYISDISKA